MAPATLKVVDNINYNEIMKWILEPESFHEVLKFLLRNITEEAKENSELKDEKIAARFRQRQA